MPRLRRGITLAWALTLQQDLNRLRTAGTPVISPAWPDHADLVARCGGDPYRVGRLVRLTRDLTHLTHRPDGSVNLDHIPGCAIPYICTDTDGRMVMVRGITLELVLATVRSFGYTKTRGYNLTTMLDNVMLAVPTRSVQRRRMTTLLHKAHSAFDPDVGDIAEIIRHLERLPQALSAAEQDYLHTLAEHHAA
jgi:hypothetical protein